MGCCRLRGRGYPLLGWSLVAAVSTPMLLRTVQAGKIDPTPLITHHFKLAHIIEAYDTFGRAAETKALKVTIET